MLQKQQILNQTNRCYDTPFTVQEMTVTTDENYIQRESWVDKYHLYADAKYTYGNEYVLARQVDSHKEIKLITKYGPKLDETMRIVIDGMICDIEHIDNIQFANKELEIRIKEKVFAV